MGLQVGLQGFVDLISSLTGGLWNVLVLLLDSIISGFQFLFTSFSIIPNYIYDFISGLPSFFSVGLAGVFGIMLGVVILKICAIIFIR